MKKVVVDTTYLLPLFGIRVKGIDSKVLLGIHEKRYTLLYPKLLVTELIAKISRESLKKGFETPPKEALEALDALLLEVDIHLIEPSKEHLENAMRLMILGHKDIFDNILYATAVSEGAYLLSMDKDFVRFLKKHGMNTEFIINHEKIKRMR